MYRPSNPRATYDYRCIEDYFKIFVQSDDDHVGNTGWIGKGTQVYYQANTQYAVFPELKSLIMKTVGMGDALKMALLPLAERIRTAFIYRSFTRGNEGRESDVDLYVVGDMTSAELVEIIGPVQLTLNREINPTVYTVDKFRTKWATCHHFIESVLEGSKVFLIGDEMNL
jgi:predicted nucleotidyltransferase